MNLDDRLDALLGASGQPVSPLPDDQDARAITPLLTAARRLAPLRVAQPSAHFAHQLERELLARAAGRQLDATARAPAHLDMDGDTPPLQLFVPRDADGGDARMINGSVPRRPQSGQTDSARRGQQARRMVTLPVWARALAAACVLLALGSGLFAAAANAEPGSTLFGLRQAERWAQVSLASPADKARLHLRYGGEALSALDSAVARRSGDSTYSSALATLQSELGAAASSIAALPAGQTRDALGTQLSALQQRARDDLRAALAALDWSDRVATTTALGGLGEGVPRVTSATIHKIAGHDVRDANHGTHAVQVVVRGSGFVAGAQLVINGQPAGIVVSVSDGTLVAQVSLNPGAGHDVSIGIENPDGTAAQTTTMDHGATVTTTPAPTATPTHHGGHGGHG